MSYLARHPKQTFRAIGLVLVAIALLPALNGAIYFSSTPHYHLMGWAIFCAANGIWIMAAGILTICYSESHEVAMRQLDHERAEELA